MAKQAQATKQTYVDPGEPVGGHDWHKCKNHSICWCDKCGLVWMGNRITQICIAAGCSYKNDPQYKRWVANGRKF